MYPTYEINAEQFENIFNVQENFLNDIKAKEIKPSKLSETVSAFANAAGGDIYVGISENKIANTREWIGFDDEEAANDMTQVLFQAHPFGNHLKFEFLKCKGQQGLVLHIIVSKVKEIVRSSSNEIFVRKMQGSQKLILLKKLNGWN